MLPLCSGFHALLTVARLSRDGSRVVVLVVIVDVVVVVVVDDDDVVVVVVVVEVFSCHTPH